MAIPYESIIASQTFRFLVGKEKKAFTIHTALLAHHSDPLNALVNGPMSEAKDGCALLKDVDEDTFVRFAEFAYRGDYTAGDPEILLDSSQIEGGEDKADDGQPNGQDEEPAAINTLPSVDEADSLWDSFAPVRRSTKHKKKYKTVSKDVRPVYSPTQDYLVPVTAPISKKEKLWKELEGQQYSELTPDFRPRENREPCEDYTPVLLSHAQLYVFAETYQVNELSWLALHKLQQTLLMFTLYDERVGDVVELLRYTYDHTYEPSETHDPLRYLVALYAACKIEKLAGDEAFQGLLKEAGDLPNDLVAKMVERLD
ncbi:MAG: uracil DNA glycosylase [Watsoniomyces obsoletus]|nr:MAG: uracil DNA glycosylase [Watsoniomyces obsoletus]